MLHGNERLDAGDAGYDGQDRLTSFEQGTLTHTNASNGSVLDTVASATLTEGFTLDSVGNWDTFSNSGTGGETRAFNAQNEITSNSGSTTPTYDYDGNMTKNDVVACSGEPRHAARRGAGASPRFPGETRVAPGA